MSWKSVKIKRGQIWRRKRNGILFKITEGSGSDWSGIRVGTDAGNKPKTHHITAFNLNREWELTTMGL